MGTLRLELGDATLREWDATVLASGPDGIVLDQSAFYPGGGGQPPDTGVLLWGGVQTRIAGARKTADDVYLIAEDGEPMPPPGTSVRGALDDERRSSLMRTHSALHLLNGVVYRDFDLLVTSAGMEPLEGRMDFDLPAVPEGFREQVQDTCNREIAADRQIVVQAMPRDEAFAIEQVARAARDLVPAHLTLEEIEKLAIAQALRLTGGNKSEAAERLGIHRTSLYDKIRRYGIAEGMTRHPHPATPDDDAPVEAEPPPNQQ